MQMSGRRGNNGFGPNDISYSAIKAWQDVTGEKLEPWELNAILRLDDAFLHAYYEHENSKTKGK